MNEPITITVALPLCCGRYEKLVQYRISDPVYLRPVSPKENRNSKTTMTYWNGPTVDCELYSYGNWRFWVVVKKHEMGVAVHV
jgi:hypothetical protein